MNIRSIIIFVFTLILSIGQVKSQINYQSEYLSGKNYFRSGNYLMAKNHFSKVLTANENNPFYLYAGYFYGISAYESGSKSAGMEELRKIRTTHPKWDKIEELNVWYGKMLLEEGDLFRGLEVINEVNDQALKAIANTLKSNLLQSYDSLALVQKAMELNPYDEILARHLAKIISKQPLVDRKIELLEFLIDSFDLNKSSYDFVDQSISQKKDTYRVAVLLPFMADGLTTTKGNKGNQFILDIYQGIQTAASELNKKGKKIELYAFDTQRDSIATIKILQSNELLQMDMIIGPLYPIPGNLVRAYSNKHRINMINPLSTNSLIIGTNPYSFLLKSSPETRAKKAANYAINNFENKNATIFYGSNSQDSIFAYTYKKILEADSFHITWIAAVKSPMASTEILRSLTEVFDTDTLSDKGKVWISNTTKVSVKEDDLLIMSRDTIGHIVVAATDNLLVSNVLSAIDTRRDSIPIIGFDDWLDFSQISFEQLQRMKVIMIGQNYFDFSSEKVAAFKHNYMKSYNKLPTQYSYDGYESMRVFGEKLIQYGNYFQYGLYDEGFQNGYLYFAFDYTNANDNQFVPITQMQNLELKMLNYQLPESKSSVFKID